MLTSGPVDYLEIELTDQIPAADLTQMLEEATEGSGMEICRIKNRIITERALKQADTEETLDDLSEMDVFSRLLDEQKDMEPQQREELIATFQEILLSMKENDVNAD